MLYYIFKKNIMNLTKSLIYPIIATSGLFFLFNTTSIANAASTNYVTSYTYATPTSQNITLSGKSVEITQAGTYTITGTLTNGQIVVNVGEDQEVKLILAGVNITSSSSAAIYVQSGKATISLKDGTTNTLTDGATYTGQVDEEPNAAVFAKEDLTIEGNGTLIVNAKLNDGVATKDDLIINGGNITINSADDAIRGKDSLTINGGNFVINSTGDALKSDDETQGAVTINGGKFAINSGSDGIEAYTKLTINAGTINIAQSVEGLESEKIIINGGDINIKSSDDGINASSSSATTENAPGQADSNLYIEFNGGNVTIDSNTDGIDSNGNVVMKGGKVIVYGPTNSGNGAMDYDGTFNISGGEIIAMGSSGMAVNASNTSTQNSVLINLTSSVEAGASITIKNSSGNIIYSGTTKKSMNSVLISSSSLKTGETYTYTIGSQTGTFSISSVTTNVGTMGRMMGGGMRGQRPTGTASGTTMPTPPTDGTMMPPPNTQNTSTTTSNTATAKIFPNFSGACTTQATSLSDANVIAYYDKLNIVNRNNTESRNLTRAEFLKLVLNAAGVNVANESAPNYSDVSSDNTLAKYIAYATRTGIVSGQNSQFRPNDTITRAEAMKILVNTTNLKLATSSTTFSDVPNTNSLANYVQTAKDNCIVGGATATTFEPSRGITVAEAAKVLYNMSK